MITSSESPPSAPSSPADRAALRAADRVSALVQQIVVSRAAELAQQGSYAQAESLLEALPATGLSTAALDLLARIRAQQGRLEEAKALWLLVLQRDPADRGAKAAISRILRLEARVRRPAAQERSLGRQAQADSASVSGGSPPQLRIDVPGVSLQPVGDEIVVTFEFPLFARADAELSQQAKRALAALGWQLEPLVGSISIVVVGQPDALPDDAAPVPRDVSALGMARAVAVFHHLTETTKLQARMFSLCTGEDFLLGHGGHAQKDQPTMESPVVLRISRR